MDLVLGGQGFIGQHVVRELLRRNRRVRVFDRARPHPDILQPSERVRLQEVAGDFTDPEQVAQALDGVQRVFHFISTTNPLSATASPVYDVETNLVSSVRLLGSMVERGVEEIIFPSSGGTVYGLTKSIPTAENNATDPINPYGIVKLAIEKYIALYRHLYGLKYTILRISNPYGPGMSHQQQGVINRYLRQTSRDEILEVWGNGEIVRDYIYIDDLIAGIMEAVSVSQDGKIFNIGSGTGTALREILSTISEVTDITPKIRFMDGRTFDVPVSILDISKIVGATGWTPRISLEEGIVQTWEWTLSQLD